MKRVCNVNLGTYSFPNVLVSFAAVFKGHATLLPLITAVKETTLVHVVADVKSPHQSNNELENWKLFELGWILGYCGQR